MADRNLWRYGETYPVQVPRLTGFAIQRGDMTWLDLTATSDVRREAPAGSVGVVKSAASYPWQGSLNATLTAFAAVFIGVSGERWPLSGNVPPIFGGQDGVTRVNTGGVFEFDVLPANLPLTIGQLVGPDAAGGTVFLPQQVAAVGAKSLAIGRVERATLPGATSVLVRIFTAEYAPLTNA